MRSHHCITLFSAGRALRARIVVYNVYQSRVLKGMQLQGVSNKRRVSLDTWVELRLKIYGQFIHERA